MQFSELLPHLLKFYGQVGLFVVGYVLFTFFSGGKKKQSQKSKTHYLTVASMLIALSFVLTRLGSVIVPLGGLPALRIGLGPIPIIIASLILGPHWGFAVGAISDVLGTTLFPQGAPIFLIFVAQGLYGVIPHYIKSVFRGNNSLVTVGITVSITQLIAGFVTTAGLALTFGWPFWESYYLRFPAQLILMVLFSLTVCGIFAVISPVIKGKLAELK